MVVKMNDDRISTIKCNTYSCQHVEQRLDAYLEGETSTREQFAIERHVAGCEHCERLISDLRHIVDMASTLGEQAVPAGVGARLRLHLEKETGARLSTPRANLTLVKP